MRTFAAVVLFVLVCVPVVSGQDAKPGLTGDEKKQVDAIIKEYFATKDWDARVKILEKLAPIDHPSKADITAYSKKCFNHCRVGPLVEAKGGKQLCTNPDYPGTYLITLGPAKSGKPTGIFVSLHGGGAGVGDGSQIQGLFGSPGLGMINIYPTVVQKDDAAWNTEREEQYVLSILDELKRTYNIDTNRIYVAGHSMGGYGTWAIGPRNPDLFAAISPGAGGVVPTEGERTAEVPLYTGVTYNLKNLPIWFYNSTDDPRVPAGSSIDAADRLEKLKVQYGAFDFVWKKYSDIGHGTPKEGLDPIWKWMMSKKRDPLPKRVLWHSSRKFKKHCYWVRRPEGLGKNVDIERDGNKFTVTGARGGLWIMVNDKMVKYEESVQVVDEKGVELYKGLVKYSLAAMLESIAAKNDPEMWFSGWIPLKQP